MEPFFCFPGLTAILLWDIIGDMNRVDAKVISLMKDIFVDARSVSRDQYNTTRPEVGGSNGPWEDDGETSAPEGIFLPDGSPFPSNSAAAIVSTRSKITV